MNTQEYPSKIDKVKTIIPFPSNFVGFFIIVSLSISIGAIVYCIFVASKLPVEFGYLIGFGSGLSFMAIYYFSLETTNMRTYYTWEETINVKTIYPGHPFNVVLTDGSVYSLYGTESIGRIDVGLNRVKMRQYFGYEPYIEGVIR